MKKHGGLMAFGDSHVAGCEIIPGLLCMPDNCRQDFMDMDSKTKSTAFPQLVADRLDFPCENLAMTGSSNARSLRQLTNNIKRSQKHIILFGYTSLSRTEFYLPHKTDAIFQDEEGFVQIMISMVERPNMFQPMDRSLAELYYKYFYEPQNNAMVLSTLIESLAIAHNHVVLHIPLFAEMAGKLDHVNHVIGFGSSGSYLTWCEDMGFEPGPYSHYGQDAHQHLADMICRYILDKALL